MAVDKLIPELWVARFLQAYDKNTIWQGLVNDVSGEFASGGNKINIGSIVAGATVRPYNRRTAIADPQFPDDADVEFVLDQEQYFNLAVDDVDRVQARPPVMDEFARKTMVNVVEVTDAHISSEFASGYPAGSTTAIDALPAEVTKTAREALIEALLAATESLDGQNTPTEGRFIVLPPGIYGQLVRYLIFDKNIGTGGQSDAAFLNAALSNMLNCRVVKDPSMPDPANAGDHMARLLTRAALVFARQIRNVEAYRSQKFFADALRGLFVYASQRIRDDSSWVLTQKA